MAAADQWFQLGERVRTSLLRGGGGGVQWQSQGGGASPIYAPSRQPGQPGQQDIVGTFNQAARLKSGHLLVVLLARNAIYQVDPESGEPEYIASLVHPQQPFLWRVLANRRRQLFCSMSGMRDLASPIHEAQFGLAGAVVRTDNHLAEIHAVASGDHLVDPCGMHFVDDTRLLVSDFAGFGGTGSIYTLDVLTGETTVLAEGGLLREPVSAMLDEDGVLWVANAYMHYFYPSRGGVVEKDDGEVLRIEPDGNQTIVLPRQSPAAGSLVGISRANTPEHVIAIKGDWPVMETGAVLRIEKSSSDVEVLLSASREEPRFYSTHVGLAGDMLWVGESYTKKLLGLDLTTGKVEQEIDFAPVMGAWNGVASSFEGLESVSVVPQLDDDEA